MIDLLGASRVETLVYLNKADMSEKNNVRMIITWRLSL